MLESVQNFEHANQQPLITVAMPIYNAGEYLRMAVLSIVQQTYPCWELFLIDDGSTDNALQSIADINDARIRIFRDGKNKGLAARLNECIDLANGQYLARMDQDDVSYPERFARQIAAMQNNPTLDLLATRAVTIDENNHITGLFPYAISHQEICARPWRGFHFPHPTWMGKVKWFRQYRYTLPGPYFCEDQELLLRSYPRSQFGTLNVILFAYRVRGKVNWQKLAKTRHAILQAQMRQFSARNLWFFVALANATFLVKRLSDALNKIRGSHDLTKRNVVADAIENSWERISEGINAE